jgi:hypothetical protein
MTQNDPRNPGEREDDDDMPRRQEREPMKAPGREDDDHPQRDPDIGNDEEIEVDDLDTEPRKP